jgi:ABC-type transporter Mla subunit MlaD
LKEHRKVESLEQSVAEQQKQIKALTASLQKVSDQFEHSKPALAVMVNDVVQN